MRGSTIVSIAVTAVALVGTACGDNTVVDGSGARSGSRLRARYHAAGDARIFLGFHDRERDEECTFRLGAGQTFARCLPRSTQTSGAFADAACMLPAFSAWETDCTPPTTYVHTPWSGCGGGVARMWRVGTFQRPSTIYWRNAAGACVSARPAPGTVWYLATEEVALDRFVLAEVRESEGPARLHERYLHGDDGSRQTIGAYDTLLGVRCDVYDAYGHRACHPDVSAGGWFWADAACTETLVERDEWRFPECAGAMAPYVAVWRNDETCGYRREIYALGEPVQASNLHYGMQGFCEPELQEDRELFALGPEVPPSALASAARVPVGSGRIRALALYADGASASEMQFFDSERGVACTVLRARDGELRCLPQGGAIIDFFIDSTCVTRRAYVGRWTDCWETWPDQVTVVDFEASPAICGEDTHRVWAAWPEIVSGSVFTVEEGACVRYQWDRSYLRFYEMAAEIPPQRFVRIDEITD